MFVIKIIPFVKLTLDMKGLLTLSLLAFFSIVSAETYYVAPDGDDQNPGTKEKPWSSWARAFKNLKAGDTLYVGGGVYYV